MSSDINKQKSTVLATLALIAANGIFGLSFIFSKTALNQSAVTPALLLMWRFILALVLLTSLLPFIGHKISLRGKPWWLLILLGFMEPVLYFLCESYGLVYSTATFSAVMIALIPIVSIMGGVVFLNERTNLKQIMFSILSIGGVVIISVSEQSEGSVQIAGIILMIGAVITAVSYNILSRALSRYFSAVERTYFSFALGAVFFSALAVWQFHNRPELIIEPLELPVFWACIIFLGAFSSVIAYLALNYAVAVLPVGRVSAFANIVTVVSVFAGILFLHENCNAIILVSAAAIIIGVWGVQKTAPHDEKSGLT